MWALAERGCCCCTFTANHITATIRKSHVKGRRQGSTQGPSERKKRKQTREGGERGRGVVGECNMALCRAQAAVVDYL